MEAFGESAMFTEQCLLSNLMFTERGYQLRQHCLARMQPGRQLVHTVSFPAPGAASNATLLGVVG